MTNYKAPLRDIAFAMSEVCDYQAHYERLFGADHASPDLVEAITGEYARFCENVLAPLYRTGDEEGCRWEGGQVHTPPGFKAAYDQFVAAGWPGLACDPVHGGQGLLRSLALILGEMSGSANIAFTLYTGGLAGAIETLAVFGTEEQRAVYEPPLIEGRWNATMCLTEPHCGSDLGLLKTRAEPADDGQFVISGTKIFITGGEHDLAENIIHLVLARLPYAPEGNKGISLFIVPKLLPVGEALEPNGVSCGSIEHKMGIKGSATCVMHFDRARGYMLGEPNRGLSAMLRFINASRVRAAFQGVSHAELGFQKSLSYARDRMQMRSLSGPTNPEGPADPIIVHPDVRRMLLTQKVFAEGNRVMLHYLAQQLDVVEHGVDDAQRRCAERRLDLLTPIAKGFATETGFEAANLALQCFGGHGYIREWGVEQNVRDARIATLYEGTTGIQGLDLIGRKVLANQGAALREFCDEIDAFRETSQVRSALVEHCRALSELTTEWQALARQISQRAATDANEMGAASVDFLMYSGYVCLAYFWARSAGAALSKARAGGDGASFYQAKLKSADFYFNHLLPRSRAHAAAIGNGGASIMALEEAHFAF
ncbi:acyl-CoA dehydrogenase C-terminal domain-containing protein [Maricaulis sp.]|uniref:acyl-CoA dehydrogenase C-terminal domain-containing protein n=1 Tax=Maricaulis sp. TaxID=1486257 RepID=UPI00343589AA